MMLFKTLLHTLAYAGLVALVFIPLERLSPAHRLGQRSMRTDILFATVATLAVQLALFFGVGWLLFQAEKVALDTQHALREVQPSTLRTLLEICVGLLIFELCGYFYHRLAHRVPLLWRLHAVHHSSAHMDWLASFRQHPLEIVLMTAVQNLPLVLLGIPLGAHAAVVLVLRLNTVFVHANLAFKDGIWSHIFATPAFHHRHHQKHGRPKNFASLFPWLDKVFGTHDRSVAKHFGLDVDMPTSFQGLMLHPFRAIKSTKRS